MTPKTGWNGSSLGLPGHREMGSGASVEDPGLQRHVHMCLTVRTCTTSPEHRILGLTESVASTATATWGYDYDPYGQPTRSTVNGPARTDYRCAGLFYHEPRSLSRPLPGL